MHQQFRADGQRRPIGSKTGNSGAGGVAATHNKPVELPRVAQFLHEQRMKIFRGELPEKIVEPLLQGCPGKTGFFRPGFQRQPAEGVVRFQPGLRHVAE
jgi:hypothetical protein